MQHLAHCPDHMIIWPCLHARLIEMCVHCIDMCDNDSLHATIVHLVNFAVADVCVMGAYNRIKTSIPL